MGLNIIVSIEIFYPQINGIITTTMNLIKNLKTLDHHPVIVTPKVLRDNPKEIEGIPVYYVPSTDALTYPGLRLVNTRQPIFKKIIEKHDADIIQTTAPWFTSKGLHIVAKKKKIPIVNTFHTNLHNPGYVQYVAPLFTNKQTFRYIQRMVWKAARNFLNPCDILVAPSPDTCKDLQRQYPHKRVKWIPNGVQIDMFSKPNNTELIKEIFPQYMTNHKQYAIYIGRLAKEKSVDKLLQGVAHTIKTIPDFHLVLVGSGPKEQSIKKMSDSMGISKNVSFLGKIDHNILIRSGLLHNAKFFTTASITETHSMTVTEALCCGVPVVVSNHESMVYLTETTGHHFQTNCPKSISEKFIEMWTDEALYSRKKEAAKQKINEFDGQHIALKYLDLYNTLLEEYKKDGTRKL